MFTKHVHGPLNTQMLPTYYCITFVILFFPLCVNRRDEFKIACGAYVASGELQPSK
jgi:hypothetical protein